MTNSNQIQQIAMLHETGDDDCYVVQTVDGDNYKVYVGISRTHEGQYVINAHAPDSVPEWAVEAVENHVTEAWDKNTPYTLQES